MRLGGQHLHAVLDADDRDVRVAEDGLQAQGEVGKRLVDQRLAADIDEQGGVPSVGPHHLLHRPQRALHLRPHDLGVELVLHLRDHLEREESVHFVVERHSADKAARLLATVAELGGTAVVACASKDTSGFDKITKKKKAKAKWANEMQCEKANENAFVGAGGENTQFGGEKRAMRGDPPRRLRKPKTHPWDARAHALHFSRSSGWTATACRKSWSRQPPASRGPSGSPPHTNLGSIRDSAPKPPRPPASPPPPSGPTSSTAVPAGARVCRTAPTCSCDDEKALMRWEILSSVTLPQSGSSLVASSQLESYEVRSSLTSPSALRTKNSRASRLRPPKLSSVRPTWKRDDITRAHRAVQTPTPPESLTAPLVKSPPP
mmetsp:Transcript_60757/g.162449  ORF Transcript_60757/g.162449 Transcript_60757/m.162449 type:complete len:376 (+) Transcript_60757:477-1604(+)